MKHYLQGVIVSLTILVVGCTSSPTKPDEGYQFGDITRATVAKTKEVISLRKEYCTEGDPEMRELIIELIRDIEPSYPLDGICQSLPQAITKLKEMEAQTGK